MIEFEWPWIFLLSPLPLILRWLLPDSATTQEAALQVPFYQELAHQATVASGRTQRNLWPLWLGLLAWLCLVLAASRPQWLGEAVELPVSGRDLMLAVDLSGSMEMEDFKVRRRTVNRLQATQW